MQMEKPRSKNSKHRKEEVAQILAPELPIELWGHIFSFLPWTDLRKYCFRVCTSFRLLTSRYLQEVDLRKVKRRFLSSVLHLIFKSHEISAHQLVRLQLPSCTTPKDLFEIPEQPLHTLKSLSIENCKLTAETCFVIFVQNFVLNL